MKFGSKVLLISAALLTLTACNSQKDSTQNPQATTQPAKPAGKVVVEVMPEDSEEATRIHKFNEHGLEFETEIKYRDGGVGTEIRNPLTKAVIESTRFYKQSKQIKTHVKYSRDGKKILLEEHFFGDGKIQRLKEKRPDGSLYFVEYYDSGVEQYHLLLRADGSGEDIRQDDSWQGSAPMVRFKAVWDATGHATIEEFDNEAKLESKSFIQPDGKMKMERYLEGKVLLVQHFRARNAEEMEIARSTFRGPWILLSMDIYDLVEPAEKPAEESVPADENKQEDDGPEIQDFDPPAPVPSEKPTRFVFFGDDEPFGAYTVHLPQENGNVIVLEVSDGGTASSYKVLDSSGKVLQELEAGEALAKWIELPDRMTHTPSFQADDLAQTIRSLFVK